MQKTAIIAAGAMALVALYLYTDAAESAAQLIDNATGSNMKLSRMAKVTAEDVKHRNVQAFLRVIRRGEGTSSADGYKIIFGGSRFQGLDGVPGTADDFSDHPRRVITRTMGGKPISSSAAGAYQFLASTWDETRSIMRLGDFSPASQDRGAVGRIAARGALDDVKAGRFDAAIVKVAKEWASMPGSPYGQPVISLATARAVFEGAGGVYSA
jgi:muramidase (phage lysozyme)